MAAGQYPRQMSGTFVVKCCKLSWLDHVCHHDMLPKIILRGRVDSSRRRDDRVNHGGTTSRNGRMYRPVIVVVACESQATEIDGRSVIRGVCRIPPTTLLRHRN